MKNFPQPRIFNLIHLINGKKYFLKTLQILVLSCKNSHRLSNENNKLPNNAIPNCVYAGESLDNCTLAVGYVTNCANIDGGLSGDHWGRERGQRADVQGW